MRLITLLSHTAEIARIAEKSPSAPDKLVSQYLRSKKYIGSKERKFISGLVFAYLRILLLVKEISAEAYSELSGTTNISLWDISLVFYISFSFKKKYDIGFDSDLYKNATQDEDISLDKRFLSKILNEKFSLNGLTTSEQVLLEAFDFAEDRLNLLLNESPDNLLSMSKLYSIPPWLAQKINTGYSDSSLHEILSSTLRPADVTLRVETNKAAREVVIEELNNQGVMAHNTQISPHGIKLMSRTKIDDGDLYKKGIIEVQDESSQLVSIALAPQPGESIMDACAGAGGKSLHIASLMNNKGTIVSCDTEGRKLEELKKRAARCAYNIITTYVIGAKTPKPLEGKRFDRVLVDAPCSGIGTIRRDPTRKYKLTPRVLDKFSSRQKEILAYYSQFVSAGGILVYATCSMLRDENMDVVDDFLSKHPDFEPCPLSGDFECMNVGIRLLPDDFTFAVTPDMFGSDGFFMARFIRTA